MSVYSSINDDKTRVGSKGNVDGGNGGFDRSPLLPIQNDSNQGTRNSIVKNIDVGRGRKTRISKFHQLLVRSPRSQRCDGVNNKIMSKSGTNALVASTSDRDPIPPPLIATPVRQNRHSTMMTLMDRYSFSPPPSVASTKTPPTTGSTASNSWRTHSATSFSTFFSHSDNKYDGFDGIDEEGLGWRCDNDDEGSQSTIYKRDSLVSKLLRNGLEQKNSSHDELDNDGCKRESHTFKSALTWSAWVCGWICLFALSISIESDGQHKDSEYSEGRGSQWMNWDYIRYASSIFWTVGGDDYPGNDGYRISDQHQIITCVFMIGSMGFMGLALGNWGDAIIRTYAAALLKKDGALRDEKNTQKYCSVARGRQIFRQMTEGSVSNYGSLALSSSKHNQYQWHDLSPLNFSDSSDDETECRKLTKDDDDDDSSFVIFPRIHWLLAQTLVLTTLSAICITTIFYCEEKQLSDRTMRSTDKNETIVGSEIGFDTGQDEWDAISTLYYAVSTATTAGLKNASVPVSPEGKLWALLFVPLSVITSLHWMVYIAQSRIQKSQRLRYEVKRRELEGVEHKVLIDERHRFDADPSRKIVFVDNAKQKLSGENGILSDDEDDRYKDDGARTPVSSISRDTESESSLGKYYEIELQRMGLVNVETFRVLKRKYELQERKKLKEEAEGY